ncbi:MAG: hypothetical protein HW416_1208, partial [Chloroflexi bacterium]|nr:hypothetical protein [Chloroflexota bacterium]
LESRHLRLVLRCIRVLESVHNDLREQAVLVVPGVAARIVGRRDVSHRAPAGPTVAAPAVALIQRGATLDLTAATKRTATPPSIGLAKRECGPGSAGALHAAHHEQHGKRAGGQHQERRRGPDEPWRDYPDREANHPERRDDLPIQA